MKSILEFLFYLFEPYNPDLFEDDVLIDEDN